MLTFLACNFWLKLGVWLVPLILIITQDNFSLVIISLAKANKMSSLVRENYMVKSSMPAIPIPEDVSVGELLMSKVEQYADRMAMVSDSGPQLDT
jgi:hypothetical protein